MIEPVSDMIHRLGDSVALQDRGDESERLSRPGGLSQATTAI